MDAILREVLPHIRAVWRYRWQALVAAWLLALVGWAAVMVMPDKYQASARVYVDTDSILLPLLEGLAVQPRIKERLSIMTQTLLSRPNIEKVVREVDLDLDESQTAMEDVIKKLSAEIRLVKSGRQKNLYTLRYASHDPVIAKQVVQALLTILVESTLGDTREDSDSAQQFLTLQIKEYDARLVAAEARLMEFKRQNFRVLPSQEGGFFQDLKQAEKNFEATKLEVREVEFERNALEKRLLEFITSFELGTVVGESRYEERIQLMQAQLDGKKLNFTEVHPDIIELKRAINELERLKRQELLGNKGAKKDGPKPEDSRLHQELTLALTQANARIASLNVRMNEYKRRANELKEQITTLPEIEADLLRLTRDYDITKNKYNQLVERFESAKLTESANQRGDNVKFRVIDPPWVPSTPSEPNRMLLLSMVLGGALAAGVGLAVLIGFVRPVVYGMYDLAKITDLSIYGAVTRLDSGVTTMAMLFKIQLPIFIGLLLLLASYGGILWLSTAGYRLFDLVENVRALLL